MTFFLLICSQLSHFLSSKIADDLFLLICSHLSHFYYPKLLMTFFLLLFSFEINMRNLLEKLTGAAYFTLAPGGTLPRYATVLMIGDLSNDRFFATQLDYCAAYS